MISAKCVSQRSIGKVLANGILPKPCQAKFTKNQNRQTGPKMSTGNRPKKWIIK